MKLRTALVLSTGLAFTLGVFAVADAADKAKAEAKLKQAVQAGEAAKITEAVDELIEVGGKDALTVVLKLAEAWNKSGGDNGIYYQLCNGAAGFTDEPALLELAKYIVQQQDSSTNKSLSRDLLFGLQNNQSGNRAKAFGYVLNNKGKYDLQLMCVDQLAQMRNVDAIDALVTCIKNEGNKGDPELRHRVLAGLQALTEETFTEPADWVKYWEGQKSKGVPERKKNEAGAGGTTDRAKPRDKEFGGTIEKQPTKRVIVLAAVGDVPPGEPGEDKAEINDYDYDSMQNVLTQYKIPHTVVKRKAFAANPEKYLKDCYALLINCHQINKQCVCPDCQPPEGDLTNRLMHCNHKCNKHDEKSYRLPKDAVMAIKRWVEEQGGFLYTEDWGLVETLMVAWPDKVTCGVEDKWHLVRKQKEDKSGWMPHIPCKLVPAKGQTSHPLMRGVWEKPHKDEPVKKDEPKGNGGTVEKDNHPAQPLEHMWTVDDESPAVEIKDPASVIPLLEAPDLLKIKMKPDDANSEGFSQIVAITFRTGNAKPEPKKQATGPGGDEGKVKGTGEWASNSAGGRVLHTMSHFGHQGGGTDDGQCLFNLIVNFLLEAAKRHGADK
ncbi:MAG TPA: hypothetical protein VFF73_41810 [Planctomycetota bacterium]|nr:hypothetical protein [Planctomycetota bacterium]